MGSQAPAWFKTIHEVAEKREMIINKITELSYKNPEQAIVFMREFGERKKPLSILLDDILEVFEEL